MCCQLVNVGLVKEIQRHTEGYKQQGSGVLQSVPYLHLSIGGLPKCILQQAAVPLQVSKRCKLWTRVAK